MNTHSLAHVPKKLLDIFDSDMHQLFEYERFLFDLGIPRGGQALELHSGALLPYPFSRPLRHEMFWKASLLCR
jgi:hypothetical protein